jgi:hypothetical protein
MHFPKIQFGSDDARQEHDNLPVGLTEEYFSRSQAVDFRAQGAQARPKLIALGTFLNLLRIHIGS